MRDASTTVAGVLAAQVGAQRARLDRAWPSVQAGDAEALRRARIASRRLREALALVEAVWPGRPVRRARREVRRVTRALGPVREIDAALDRFGAAVRHHGWSVSRVAPVRRRLDREQARRRATLQAWLDAEDLHGLDRRLEAIGTRVAALEAPAIEQALGVRILRRSRAVQQAIARCGTLYAPARLHAVRIAIKKLRYALELGQAIGYVAFGPVIAALARVQKRFGRLHDIQMLQADVQAATGRSVAARLTGALVDDALERECRSLHGSLVAEMADIEARLAEVRWLVAKAALAADSRRPLAMTGANASRAPRTGLRRTPGGRYRRASGD
jgi:CHAD domain-containing protein